MILLNYGSAKDAVKSFLHLSPDALHIHTGLLLFLGIALLLRTERRWVQALGGLLLLCLLGEFIDLSSAYARGRTLRWMDSLRDIVNTMLWPTAWVIARPFLVKILRKRDASVRKDFPTRSLRSSSGRADANLGENPFTGPDTRRHS